MSTSKRSIFGIVFLTIFLDMVGFSIIFPLFPAMLDHYLFLEESMGGGILSRFVQWVSGFGHDILPSNPNFRLETVIFGGILGSLYAVLQFFFAPIWGGLSYRFGRKPILLFTLTGTAMGYFLLIGTISLRRSSFTAWSEIASCTPRSAPTCGIIGTTPAVDSVIRRRDTLMPSSSMMMPSACTTLS